MRSSPPGEDQQQATNHWYPLTPWYLSTLEKYETITSKDKEEWGAGSCVAKCLPHKREDLNSNHHQRALNKVGHGHMLTQPEAGRSQELPSWLVQSTCELQGKGETPVSIRNEE